MRTNPGSPSGRRSDQIRLEARVCARRESTAKSGVTPSSSATASSSAGWKQTEVSSRPTTSAAAYPVCFSAPTPNDVTTPSVSVVTRLLSVAPRTMPSNRTAISLDRRDSTASCRTTCWTTGAMTRAMPVHSTAWRHSPTA